MTYETPASREAPSALVRAVAQVLGVLFWTVLVMLSVLM